MSISKNNNEPKQPMFWFISMMSIFVLYSVTIEDVIKKYNQYECAIYTILCLIVLIITCMLFFKDIHGD